MIYEWTWWNIFSSHTDKIIISESVTQWGQNIIIINILIPDFALSIILVISKNCMPCIRFVFLLCNWCLPVRIQCFIMIHFILVSCIRGNDERSGIDLNCRYVIVKLCNNTCTTRVHVTLYESSSFFFLFFLIITHIVS